MSESRKFTAEDFKNSTLLGIFLVSMHRAAENYEADANMFAAFYSFDKKLSVAEAEALSRPIFWYFNGSFADFLFADEDELIEHCLLDSNSIHLIDALRAFIGNYYVDNDPDGSWHLKMLKYLPSPENMESYPSCIDILHLLCQVYVKSGDDFILAIDAWDGNMPVDFSKFDNPWKSI